MGSTPLEKSREETIEKFDLSDALFATLVFGVMGFLLMGIGLFPAFFILLLLLMLGYPIDMYDYNFWLIYLGFYFLIIFLFQIPNKKTIVTGTISAPLHIDITPWTTYDVSDGSSSECLIIYVKDESGRKVLDVRTFLDISSTSYDSFISGNWVNMVLELYSKSSEMERKSKYQEHIAGLRQRLWNALAEAKKWGFEEELNVSSAEAQSVLSASLDQLVTLSNEITSGDELKMGALREQAIETMKQIEALGLVRVVSNVCIYCMAYMGDSSNCPQCGASRRVL